MHGLFFRTIQAFVTDSYGRGVWTAVAVEARLEFDRFEAMFDYEADLLPHLLEATARILDRPVDTILEDIGTYLVSHPNNEPIRRLMRFGGEDFIEFLHSLDDLPGRTRLAVPGLALPLIDLREHTLSRFTVACGGEPRGFGHVLVGLLRAMADDYGTLAVLEFTGRRDGLELVDVSVLDSAFARGRSFTLTAGPVAAVS